MYFSKTVSGRRRRGVKRRQRLLARYRQSPLTQRDFAARHGIGLSTLCRWLRVEGAAMVPAVKFQEVVLPHTPSPWAVEVVSPQGWVVRLPSSAALESLPHIIRALPC